VEWFDVVACRQLRSWTMPFAITGDVSQNPSADGRLMALWDATRMVVVDMDPQAPLASYAEGNRRMGPLFDLVTDCGFADCTVKHAAVSPSGKYVVVGYANDRRRGVDLDPATLALSSHPIPPTAPNCDGQDPAKGAIVGLGHEGMAINPCDNNEEVIVGQRRSWCPTVIDGKELGRVVMVRLRDGAVTSLTDITNEAYAYHVSTMAYGRPGWAYVSYAGDEPGKRFTQEVVAVKMDGSGTVERYAHLHTDQAGCYRCEAHPMPSRDGRRVLFASSWSLYCGSGCGSQSVPRTYIVERAR